MLRMYTIKNISEITPEIIKDCVQTSMDTLRKENTDINAVLKWEGNTPAWVGEEYMADEIKVEMKKVAWSTDEDI